MRDFISLGSTPCNEDCACVGEDRYRERALAECQRYITLLRRVFGPEPAGARLSTKWFDHDFGEYVEVVCYYHTDISESMDYAFRCEDEMPVTWDDGGRTT